MPNCLRIGQKALKETHHQEGEESQGSNGENQNGCLANYIIWLAGGKPHSNKCFSSLPPVHSV